MKTLCYFLASVCIAGAVLNFRDGSNFQAAVCLAGAFCWADLGQARRT